MEIGTALDVEAVAGLGTSGVGVGVAEGGTMGTAAFVEVGAAGAGLAAPPGTKLLAPGLKTKAGAAALNFVVLVLTAGLAFSAGSGVADAFDAAASFAARAAAAFLGSKAGIGDRAYIEDFFC